MYKFLVLSLLTLFVCACGDNDDTQNVVADNVVKNEMKADAKTHFSNAISYDLIQAVNANQNNFMYEFNKLDDAQQYYFCAAFAMGAMSVAKPITASAMVNYFIGLGVVEHNRGIDKDTYKAFDFGKNIFHFEKVVNVILQERICENIIGKADKTAKEKKVSTKQINALGKNEVKKIVSRIKK